MERQVKTDKGIVEGVLRDECIVFKGIPYAKPPIGELRWKAPQEMDEWEGVYHADTFPSMCVQNLPKADDPYTGRFLKEFYSAQEYLPEMSEDCLYLNIWVPKEKSEELLPVAFWIHGGGFGGGFSSEIEFDGEEYCKKGVILVTINYRLNIYGFLAHPWLSEENEKGISGNYGILDQIAALKWVERNIEKFGGDKNNITVFGQSAGSMSTQILISSKLTENIPAKAIMQSGMTCADSLLYTPTMKEEEEIGEIFVRETGAKNLEELRKLSPERIKEARQRFDLECQKMGKGIVVVPCVDGYVLEKTVGEVWKTGKMKNIPYMCGVVTDELGSTKEEIEEKRTGRLMEECKRWCMKRSEADKPAYLYYFSHELPGDDWGAFHTGEVWYMFGTLHRCWRPMTEEDQKLSDEMVTYWTNFMKTGVPECKGTQEWKAYTKENRYIKEFH